MLGIFFTLTAATNLKYLSKKTRFASNVVGPKMKTMIYIIHLLTEERVPVGVGGDELYGVGGQGAQDRRPAVIVLHLCNQGRT